MKILRRRAQSINIQYNTIQSFIPTKHMIHSKVARIQIEPVEWMSDGHVTMYLLQLRNNQMNVNK